MHASRTGHMARGRGKEIVVTLGMDKIWMPFLEQSCNRVAGRWGGGLGPDSRTVLEVGANKRHRI